MFLFTFVTLDKSKSHAARAEREVIPFFVELKLMTLTFRNGKVLFLAINYNVSYFAFCILRFAFSFVKFLPSYDI